MVQALTGYSIFATPFSSKSFRFFALAYRAVALFTILTVKRMAILTELSHSIHGRNRVRISQAILTRGYHSKMSRINTMSVLADVVNQHTLIDIPSSDEVCNTVRPPIELAEEKCAVSVSIERPSPKSTVAVGNPFTIKPLKFLVSDVHGPIVPYMPCVNKGDTNE